MGAFSYAACEEILGKLFHAASPARQKGALKGRLKHLGRLEIPLLFGPRPGRNVRIEYDRDHLLQLAFSLELEEAGINPTTIAGFIKSLWVSHLRDRFADAATGKGNPILCLDVRLMSAGWDDPVAPFGFRTVKRVESVFATEGVRRVIAIDMQAICQDIDDAIAALPRKVGKKG